MERKKPESLREEVYFDNKFKKDPIMEEFEKSMQDAMNKFFDKQQLTRQQDFERKMYERQLRVEEEFKRKERQSQEKKL